MATTDAKKKKKKQKKEEKEDDETKEKREENGVDQKQSIGENQEFKKMAGPQHGDGKKDEELASSTTNSITADKDKDSPSKCDQPSSPGKKSIESGGKQSQQRKDNKDDGQEKRVELDKSMKSSTDQHVKGSDGVNKEDETDRQEQPVKDDTDDKSMVKKMDTSSVAGEETDEKDKTENARVIDQNAKDEPPENWDMPDVEVEIESGGDEKTMQNTSVVENSGNLEGSEKIDPKQDSDEKGMFSKLVDGAKSLLGYPQKQVNIL